MQHDLSRTEFDLLCQHSDSFREELWALTRSQNDLKYCVDRILANTPDKVGRIKKLREYPREFWRVNGLVAQIKEITKIYPFYRAKSNSEVILSLNAAKKLVEKFYS